MQTNSYSLLIKIYFIFVHLLPASGIQKIQPFEILPKTEFRNVMPIKTSTAGRWVASLLFSLVLRTSVAQVYYFQHYDIFSGLGQSQVSDIEQDRFGYIWLSTRGGGLSRFDGLHFTTYRKEDNLPANNILSLEINAKGLMYIGTPFGLSIYDGKNTRPVRSPNRELFVSSVIGDQKGNVYAICNASQLGKITNDSLVFLTKNGPARPSFFSDMSGTSNKRLMVSTFSGEIFEVAPTGLQSRYHTPEGMVLRCILFDSKDSLWLGTDRGIFRAPTNKPLLEITDLQFISEEVAHEMTETSDGSVWAGLAMGALRYHKGNILRFNAQNGFTSFMVKGLLEDREGNIWFTTDGDGVYKFTNPAFTSLNSTSGLSGETISCFALAPDGKLWISYFDEGMDILDTKTNKVLPLPKQLQGKRINCLAVDNEGNTWVGLAAPGVYKISKTSIEYIPLDTYISSQEVALFMEAGKGKEMWISTSNGVVLYDGKQLRHYTSKQGLKGRFVRRTLQLNDNEVIASGPRGLNIIKNGLIYDFVYDDELASFPALSMAKRADGLLALGSFEDGIAVFDPKTRKKNYFTVKNGLCSNLIYNTVFDKQGRLWIGTERGIDLLTIDKDLKISNIRHYNETDGFTARETNANTAYITADGEFWVGTIKGLFRYSDTNNKSQSEALKVHFTDIRIPFDTTDLSQYARSQSNWNQVYEGLSLPHTKNQLKISFITINHRRPDHIRYQYQLEGADEGWLGPTDQTSVVYSHLTPGCYQFKVRASYGDNQWSDISTYEFEIIPPFYQRWWFILLLAGTLVSLGILSQRLYIQYRTRRVLAYEKLKQEAEAVVRVQIAQDFHDELGNRLAAIRMQSNVLKLRYNGHESEEKRIVGEIEKNVVRLFRDTKDFIWSIDPESNQINELALYIKDLGENLLQDTPIHFHTDICFPKEYEHLSLPPGWSIQVIMIFKEALTNCVKHSQCQNIIFSATIENRQMSFALTDDGIGIKYPTEGYHKGLINMRLRSERIHCSLSIIPTLPKGTTVLLRGQVPTKTASPKSS
ncbi:sensor histidine kinase [Runella sp.]|uniref:sensor histidine kinase n=1 Tax=Runella sp. TaxID=1960881 RepID=UPI003D1325AC